MIHHRVTQSLNLNVMEINELTGLILKKAGIILPLVPQYDGSLAWT